MAASSKNRIWVCASKQLAEGCYRRVDVLFRGHPSSVVAFRLGGKCRAFRNLCVHMPRELDCEVKTIFDKSGQRLRCSMHGIVYDPTLGESLSTMCNGQRLTPIGLDEDANGVWIVDKRTRPISRDG